MLSRLKDKVREAFQEEDYGCPENCQKDLKFRENPPNPIKSKGSLTPSFSNTISKQRTSPFFAKLPAEIRRLILIEAFGERTLHVDLSDYCNRANRPEGRSATMICLPRTQHILPVVGGCGPSQHLGHARPPKNKDLYQWRWWSSVCHRNLPGNLHGSMGARDDHSTAPWDDDCRSGAARHCKDWGIPGLCCKVGALGFLRSCNQAYVEGLDILYGTNTFHIANSTMFPRLPQLIVSDRLADIASLEVVWDHYELTSIWGSASPTQMTQYLHVLSDHLTGLTKIFISIAKMIVPGHADMKEDILKPLDEFVRSTPRMREMCVSVPFWSFSNDIIGSVNPTPQAVLHAKVSGEKFAPLHVWRPLSEEYVVVEVTDSSYPDAPVGVPKYLGNGGLAGYWIMEGHGRNSDRHIHPQNPMDVG